MDNYLYSLILESINSGDIPKLISYVFIFSFLWIEVRGLKKEVSKLNITIGSSFTEGEKRFDALEQGVKKIDQRLALVELKPLGGQHG